MNSANTFTRHLCRMVGTAVVSLLLMASVHAANNIAVASLVGDKVTVVRSGMQTGSHLDPNKRYAVALPEEGIDGDILLIMQSAVTQQCASCKVTLLKTKIPDAVEESERLLPSLLAAARDSHMDRLVVLTKYRSDARIKLEGGSIVGQGKIYGLGFYTESRASGTQFDESEYQQGYVAPFAYFKIFVIDVNSGNVLKEKIVLATKAIPGKLSSDLDPLNALKGNEKVTTLLDLVKVNINESLDMKDFSIQ